MRVLVLFLFAVCCLPDLAQAECSWAYSETSGGCDNLGISNTLGRSVPLIADVILLNAAALPSMLTPAGIETSYSSRVDGATNSKLSVSFVKGFQGFGVGFGTWDETGFSKPDLSHYFNGSTFESKYQDYKAMVSGRPGIQGGTSIGIPTGPFQKYFRLRTGGSVGRTASSNRISGSYGVIADGQWINLGFSIQQLNISKLLPQIRSGTFNAGIQVESIYFGFSRSSWLATSGFSPTDVFSLRYGDPVWVLYGALKKSSDLEGNSQSWYSASLHRHLNEHLGLGYIYGLYLHAHSMNAQVFF